jgi:hypothetical protein
MLRSRSFRTSFLISVGYLAGIAAAAESPARFAESIASVGTDQQPALTGAPPGAVVPSRRLTLPPPARAVPRDEAAPLRRTDMLANVEPPPEPMLGRPRDFDGGYGFRGDPCADAIWQNGGYDGVNGLVDYRSTQTDGPDAWVVDDVSFTAG